MQQPRCDVFERSICYPGAKALNPIYPDNKHATTQQTSSRAYTYNSAIASVLFKRHPTCPSMLDDTPGADKRRAVLRHPKFTRQLIKFWHHTATTIIKLMCERNPFRSHISNLLSFERRAFKTNALQCSILQPVKEHLCQIFRQQNIIFSDKCVKDRTHSVFTTALIYAR